MMNIKFEDMTKEELRDALVKVGVELSNTKFKATKRAILVDMIVEATKPVVNGNEDVKEELEMNKEIKVIDDGELGTSGKIVIDEIPEPINKKKEEVVVENNTVVEEKKEVGTVEDNKETVKLTAVVIDKANVGEPNEKGFRSIKDVFCMSVSSGAYFGVVGIEPSGLYKLINYRGTNSWMRDDVLHNINFYASATKEVATKVMNELAVAQSPATKTVKTEDKKIETPKESAHDIVLKKAKEAGEYAKTKFEFRIEQVNNFRQVILINNKTGEQTQVGVGATIAGRVLDYEAEITDLKKQIGTKKYDYKVAEDKAKYNPSVKRTKILCVECQKEGKKHYISEAELSYLKDNMKYVPEEFKNKGLCYKHQATTGVRRAIIAGRRNDVQAGNTSIENTTTLL